MAFHPPDAGAACRHGEKGSLESSPPGHICGSDRCPRDDSATKVRQMTLKLCETMHDADYVVIDGIVFETAYMRVPDEFTVADDVILEARRGDTELEFTQADFEDAEHVADGFYRLGDGHVVRFLTSATVH
jgi:hypothetical protein